MESETESETEPETESDDSGNDDDAAVLIVPQREFFNPAWRVHMHHWRIQDF